MAKEKVKNTQAQEQQYANKYVIAMAKEKCN